jgi:predicted nucleotidyltransferase component of viral defense system
MSQSLTIPRKVIIAEWVEQARADPVRHMERQVTEILLHAIGITPILNDTLVLKGGILMSLAHGSSRQTGDVDFTAIVDPQPYAGQLRGLLDQALQRAAASLGYLDLVCAVQRFEYKPRPDEFEAFRAPALKLTIGYARRGEADEARLRDRRSTKALQIDVSFRERVLQATELVIDQPEVSIRTYAPEEIIAEKLRALLQQPGRDRSRRQDVYDIDWLVERYGPDEDMKAKILHGLITKSADRDLVPTIESFDDPEVKRRAQIDWDTLRLEIGDLPEFDPTFGRVVAFYKSLPWNV